VEEEEEEKGGPGGEGPFISGNVKYAHREKNSREFEILSFRSCMHLLLLGPGLRCEYSFRRGKRMTEMGNKREKEGKDAGRRGWCVSSVMAVSCCCAVASQPRTREGEASPVR